MKYLIPHDSPGFLLIIIIVLYLIYWLMVENSRIRKWFTDTFGNEKGTVAWFVWNKIHGTFLFGIALTIIVVLLYPNMNLKILFFAFPKDATSWIIAIVLTTGLGCISWLKNKSIHKKHASFGRYPELNIRSWSISTLALDIGMWMLYLFAYELMFRGVLLGILTQSLGFWSAVGINVALYAAVHIPKGTQEAIGALVLGYVLCVLTITSGSLFTAWASHCALAIVNDVSAYYYQKEQSEKST